MDVYEQALKEACGEIDLTVKSESGNAKCFTIEQYNEAWEKLFLEILVSIQPINS